MPELKYEEVKPKTRDEIEVALASGDPKRIEEALYSGTYYIEDWKWMQDLCLEQLKSGLVNVRWAAAQCLGDIAQIRGHLDLDRVLPALSLSLHDPEIRSTVQDSLDLIRERLQVDQT